MEKAQGFVYEKRHVSAFDVIGFSEMERSGGKLYSEIREDGRWEILKAMNSNNKTIFGIASDDACPESCDRRTDICLSGRCYRYTMGITNDESYIANPAYSELFKFHIKESDWIVFKFDENNGHGELWGNDPYKMIAELGHEYNSDLSIHIDVWHDKYTGEHDGINSEFWMPING